MSDHPPLSPDAARINTEIRYCGYAVYTRHQPVPGPGPEATSELVLTLSQLAADGVQVRGLYDVCGMRADADVMIWWLAESAQALQQAARTLRRTAFGAALRPRWSAIGLHRPSEFNKNHVPGAYLVEAAKEWLTVYPFVRSYEWYVLPSEERRELLREHGAMGREYPQVLATTVSAFALGDYEWILALESDRLEDTVDCMRHLRASKARLHVRVETPFFTGRRIAPAEVIESLA